MHHIDRPRLFRDSRAKDGLESTLLFLRHPKIFLVFLHLLSNPKREKSSANVLIDKMRHRNTPFRVFLAHIAQSVERSPLKRMAAGSIPVVGMRRCLFF